MPSGSAVVNVGSTAGLTARHAVAYTTTVDGGYVAHGGAQAITAALDA